jgi:hypothetical protein
MRNFNSAFNHIINYISVLPFLYRYENQSYIEQFFETGDLFISSFNNYKKYKDNQLGDKDEGSSINFANTDKDLTISTFVTVGRNEYTFCTSTILDQSLLTTFSRDSVFRIKDPINFILEVTRSLPRVNQVLHGSCLYLDQRMLMKNISGVDMETLKSEDGGISFEKLMQVSNYVQGRDAFFLKQKKYQKQSEYRILWQTDRQVKEGIIIKCPEAIKYCERIELKDI